VDQALDLYESGIGLPAEGYHNLGLIYAERGLWDQSLEAYQHALAQAPDMTIVFFSMAGVHLLQGDVEAASRNYETFLEHWTGKPDYVRDAQHRLRQVYPVLGDRYLRAGQIDQAVSVFTRLIDMGAGSAAIYNNLVLLYGRLRQYDKAIAMGEACQNLYPDFVQIHLSLATVYGNRSGVKKELKRILETIAR
jgi:tetratricopeptide (TPR) repeat protein